MSKGSTNRAIIFVVIVTAVALLLFGTGAFTAKPTEADKNTVAEQIKNDEVEKVTVEERTVTIKLKDGTEEVMYLNAEEKFQEEMIALGVTSEELRDTPQDVKRPSSGDFWFQILLTFLPFALIIGFFYLMMRQAQGTNNQALSFGKSKARVFGPDKQKVLFNDVAGAEEAKQELQEIVEFLKYPQKFISLGARIPRGVLLFGAPGTGKTLLARAVAGEAGVPFFSISGSEFVEMFVGVGASRVRDLFNKAKKNAPAIVFIDEIDAVGRQRGTGLGGGHDEREQTLNQILVEMDGFDTSEHVIVMAATNRPDVLDPALLRPGRFDRRVIIDPPDIKQRKAILEVHSKGKPLAKEVTLETIARQTPGFSGADLANLVNEAAIFAARMNRTELIMPDFYEAVEKVLLGPERKSRLMNEHEKKITAYHEGGHALVSHLLPHCDPVHKVSIISRGQAGGVTWNLPLEDKRYYSKLDFEDELAAALAGRAAEELVFGDITTGAESDMQKATALARRMVTEYGMADTEELRNRVFGHREEVVFLGRDFSTEKSYSEVTAAKIDHEINGFIDRAYEKAMQVLKNNQGKLDLIAAKLIEKEALEGPEFESLFKKIPTKKAKSVVARGEYTSGKKKAKAKA